MPFAANYNLMAWVSVVGTACPLPPFWRPSHKIRGPYIEGLALREGALVFRHVRIRRDMTCVMVAQPTPNS